MQAENWETVKELLQKVLQLEPLKRRKFLDEPGISLEIREEVESLLAFEEETEDYYVAFGKCFFKRLFLER